MQRTRPAGSTAIRSIILFLLSLSSVTAWSPRRSFQLSMSTNSPERPQHVVIAGAGVIGLSTSYYLATNFGIRCTIVDPSGEIAPAASGKAGGFLALDWNDFSPVGQLARRSFDLHQTLADTMGADTLQYRRLTCAAISVNPSQQVERPKGKKLAGVEWVDDDNDDSSSTSAVLGMRPLGDESTIAQVHPKRLCENLWKKACKCSGSTLVQGQVVAPVYKEQDQLIGAQLQDGSTIKADALLFACGPWAVNIMSGVKYHSVVIPTERVLTQSVFFKGCGDPEVYPRPDQTAYCTGFPDAPVKVTEQPGKEEVRSEAVSRIVNTVQTASGGALGAEPSTRQACYLPSTPDGLPIMGRLPKMANCFVAAGHSCWGILLGPASGESMAQLIATGENNTEHVNLSPYNPSRFAGIGLDEQNE